jgi:hypothetical protein
MGVVLGVSFVVYIAWESVFPHLSLGVLLWNLILGLLSLYTLIHVAWSGFGSLLYRAVGES